MGERSESATHGDATSGTLATVSETAATNNAGMLAHVERRTASTSLELSVPAGFAAHSTTVGELQAGYYTPHLGVLYGSQGLNFLGGVPAGSTVRGLSFVLPLRGGDITLINGPAYGTGQTTMRVNGVRARGMHRSVLWEAGYDRITASDGSLRAADAIVGVAQNRGLLSQSFEAALQHQTHSDSSQTPAYAYQYRADYGTSSFSTSVTARRISDGFLNLGSGQMQRDDYAALGFHTYIGSTNVTADNNVERSGTGDATVVNERDSIAFNRNFLRSNVSTELSFNDQRALSSFGTAWTGGATAQVGFSVRNVATTLGVNAQRSTQSFGPASVILAYIAELQRQFGSYFASAGYQTTRQSGQQDQLQSVGNFALTRTLGKTALTVSDAITHVLAPGSNVTQSTPEFTITRYLSPALSIAMNYGAQRTVDRLNPSGNATTRIFGFQIAAPFALGSGVVRGRIDPNLPATIGGMVVDDSDATQFTSFASAIGNGVGNIAVVLDGNEVQRTDLSGRFQFNFVKPGIHQLRLETSSLPRGITADQPFATLTVLGGQTGNVNFRLGTYGGVEGKIYGRDPGGQLYPLSNVVVRLDDTLLTTTGPLGAYGFGRLSAGTHSVTIDPSSVPANVGMSETKKTIVVRNGVVGDLDFVAAPLGSIEGKLVYDSSLAPLLTGPVLNAYVVAEPGEHAAITDDNGNFIIDNLTAGTYTVDVDGETLQPETGNVSGAQTVTLDSSGHVNGLTFTIGHKLKQVVFSLKSDDAPATLVLSQSKLPPGATAGVAIDAPAGAKSVTASLLGKRFPLHYDPSSKRWVGDVAVPLDAKGGSVDVTAEVVGVKSTPSSASLTVDPSVPLATFTTDPARPVKGQFVRVRARVLTTVRSGITIRWNDGQVTKVARPRTGRVFEFTVKISEQPMRGLLLSQGSELPILLR